MEAYADYNLKVTISLLYVYHPFPMPFIPSTTFHARLHCGSHIDSSGLVLPEELSTPAALSPTT